MPPFKNSKSKGGKKKGKKNSKKTKDEWSHEGGQLVGDSSSAAGEESRKRRRTQDRDERIRRSRAKINDRRRHEQFYNKMAKRVKFGDENDDSAMVGMKDNVDDAIAASNKGPRFVRSNPLSTMERLKYFLSKDKLNNEHDNDNMNFTHDDDDDDDDKDASPTKSAPKDDEVEVENSRTISFDDVEDQDVGDDEDDIEGVVDDASCSSDDDKGKQTNKKKMSTNTIEHDLYYEQMFKVTKVTPSDAKMKLLGAVGDGGDEIYGNLNVDPPNDTTRNHTRSTTSTSVLPARPGPYTHVNQMPGLHKLFRGTSQQTPAAAQDANTTGTTGVTTTVADRQVKGELGPYLLPYLSTYADVFVDGRSHNNDLELLHTMLLHTITHTVKARAKVIKHNQKLKRKQRDALLAAAMKKEVYQSAKARRKAERKESLNKANSDVNDAAEGEGGGAHVVHDDNDDGDDEAMRDQGYVRPRVLILCPFRGTALRIVHMIRAILGENTSISGLEKMQDEYASPDDVEEEKGDVRNQGKPQDWKDLFNQNIDDDFKMGIQLNPGHGKGSGAEKGVYMRLYSDFLISDIILASPIGLRLAIGASTKKQDKNKGKSDNDDDGATINTSGNKSGHGETPAVLTSDFLTSLEMIVLHQADVLYMQNWEHVEYVMKQSNKLPKLMLPDTDFSRVRQYFLDGQAAQHRQLLVTSNFNEPELQAFFRVNAHSANGMVRLKTNWGEGFIGQVFSSVRQVFQQVPGVKDYAHQEDVRFNYFKEHVLAPLLRIEQSHTLIVSPSYLNYVRLRNELMHQDASAVYICEYSRDSEISRGRARFFHGQKQIMLYSGRAHFFRRFHIRGARHLIFYSLPEYAHFYAEFVNMLSEQHQSAAAEGTAVIGAHCASSSDATLAMEGVSCLVIFTQYERMALERLVGHKRCAHILSSAKSTFMFC